MSENRRCPCCGYLWDVPHAHGRDDFGADLVDSMSREIRYLRETVAKLRAAGAGRSIPVRPNRATEQKTEPWWVGAQREAAHEAAT